MLSYTSFGIWIALVFGGYFYEDYAGVSGFVNFGKFITVLYCVMLLLTLFFVSEEQWKKAAARPRRVVAPYLVSLGYSACLLQYVWVGEFFYGFLVVIMLTVVHLNRFRVKQLREEAQSEGATQ